MTEIAVAACPACGASERAPFLRSYDHLHGRPGSFTLTRCGNCGSSYLDPRPAPEELATYYPSDYSPYVRQPSRTRLFARRSRAARLWYATVRGVLRDDFGYDELGGSRALAATLGRVPALRRRATFGLGVLLQPWRRDGSLLEVGCGIGNYLDLMRALGWGRVVGVDISETAVRITREALGLEAYAGTLEDVNFDAETFDAISMRHTLEHIADPVALLGECHRVLRPGGRVAIVVPNAAGPIARLRREHWSGLDTPRHLVNFTPHGLQMALERTGLRDVDVRTSAQNSQRGWVASAAWAFGEPANDRVRRRRDRQGAAVAAAAKALCLAGLPAGEEIWAVARR